MSRGSLSSELLMCGEGVRSILFLPLLARCLETIDVCIWRIFVFYVCCSDCVPPATEGDASKVYPFSEGEYNKEVAALKNNKGAGRDDILVEQLKHLGPKAHKWRLTMLNICFMENKIPTIWRQSKIIAILKPGKDFSIPKNYRPISLLCHTYKLYERMILNRIAPAIEQHLIKEQAGFRSGKSCTSQLLNLTQQEEDMITGTAFVDLSAAYDTVNHRLLIQKLYNTTLHSQLCRVIQNLLSDRRFYVELNNERSRWRIQKNGLPQGSVLSPTLFNIYIRSIRQSLMERGVSYTQTTCASQPSTLPSRFQRSQPTRGGTVWQLQIPANRDQLLS